MKGALCLLVVVACSASPTPKVTLARVPVAAPPPLAHVPEPPEGAVLVTSTRDATWARAFPTEKGFVVIDVPAAPSLFLDWRIGVPHPFKNADGEVYDLPITPIALAVGARDEKLGEFGGTARPAAQTYCAHLGWHRANDGETPAPPLPSLVSKAALGTMQGDDDFMIVRDGSVLHVLHRQTSDGKCDEAKQGPLDVCEGEEWKRRVEIRLAGDPALFERISDGGKPIDCGAPSFYGDRLLPPKKTSSR
jgi:hypothetical protein